MVLEANSPRVYLVGKVNKPGMYMMTGQTTVIQALAWAGGLTPYADAGGIRIIRNTNEGQRLIEFDYDKLEGGFFTRTDLSQNVFLQPGDTILVP